MSDISSLRARDVTGMWAAIRLLGLFCATAGMAVINAADAVEYGGSFPWLKVAVALAGVGIAVGQGRRLRAAVRLGARPPL